MSHMKPIPKTTLKAFRSHPYRSVELPHFWITRRTSSPRNTPTPMEETMDSLPAFELSDSPRPSLIGHLAPRSLWEDLYGNWEWSEPNTTPVLSGFLEELEGPIILDFGTPASCA